jgi:hypothetical protein
VCVACHAWTFCYKLRETVVPSDGAWAYHVLPIVECSGPIAHTGRRDKPPLTDDCSMHDKLAVTNSPSRPERALVLMHACKFVNSPNSLLARKFKFLLHETHGHVRRWWCCPRASRGDHSRNNRGSQRTRIGNVGESGLPPASLVGRVCVTVMHAHPCRTTWAHACALNVGVYKQACRMHTCIHVRTNPAPSIHASADTHSIRAHSFCAMAQRSTLQSLSCRLLPVSSAWTA